MRVNLQSVASHRLSVQALTTPRSYGCADLVRTFGAVQSQDLPLAKWSLGQRLTGCTVSDVDSALADGSILRTHILRPTWHFVARDDLRWMLALSAPRVLAKARPYDVRAGMDEAMAATALKVIEKALVARGPLTRTELTKALRARLGEVSNWLVGHLLMHAELRGVICSGPSRGAHQTYALLDERAPGGLRLTREESVAELARRYFRSHAPATELDYRWWSGLSAVDARRGIEALGDAAERVVVDGVPFILWREAPAPARTNTTVQLLQPFDEFVVAYTESRRVVDVAGLARQEKADGLLTRCVVVDGQVAGRWNRTLDRRSLLRVEPLRRLSAREARALADAAGQYAAFLGEPLTLDTTQADAARRLTG